MLQICGALLLLAFELIIEYFAGAMLTKLLLKKDTNPGMNLLVGFISYQVLFQVLALVVVCTTGILHHLSIAWGVSLIVLVPLSYWYGRDTVKNQIGTCIALIKSNKGPVMLFVVVVLAFAYYTCINGELNEDARYYIGLMTTSVETDSLFKYNVYTGMEMESFYLRRALATFEVHSAVISQISGIHPLLIARIFRACQNVILTSVAVLLCGKTLFWKKEENGIAKALLATVVFWVLQLLFAQTIYTPARFLLYRTYEAKAFTSNFVVLLGLYLCVKLLRERKMRYLILLGIYLWSCMALSTSAIIVAVVECGVILIPVLVQERLHAS